MKLKIARWTCDVPDYFPGFLSFGTPYDSVHVGVGDSLDAAFEDAAESIAQISDLSDADQSELDELKAEFEAELASEMESNGASPDEGKSALETVTPNWYMALPDEEETEYQMYVVIGVSTQ